MNHKKKITTLQAINSINDIALALDGTNPETCTLEKLAKAVFDSTGDVGASLLMFTVNKTWWCVDTDSPEQAIALSAAILVSRFNPNLKRRMVRLLLNCMIDSTLKAMSEADYASEEEAELKEIWIELKSLKRRLKIK